MDADPTTEPVTALIIFTGVMLMCINDDKQCEVGMIQCPDHDPKIMIREFKSGAQTDEYELPWSTDHDLIFKVFEAEAEGVVIHPGATGDFDFKKVIDLEGPDFHNGEVTVNTASFNGRRLGVTSGKLYTHKLNEDEFDQLTWTDASDPGTRVKSLGKTAQEVGLSIVCRNQQGRIDLLDSVTGEVLKSLPNLADLTYQIEVNNDCGRVGETQPEPAPTPTPLVGTDFRYYYNVVRSQDGRKFDLTVSTTAAPPTPWPGICELAFLSKTNTLGFTWPNF